MNCLSIILALRPLFSTKEVDLSDIRHSKMAIYHSVKVHVIGDENFNILYDGEPIFLYMNSLSYDNNDIPSIMKPVDFHDGIYTFEVLITNSHYIIMNIDFKLDFFGRFRSYKTGLLECVTLKNKRIHFPDKKKNYRVSESFDFYELIENNIESRLLESGGLYWEIDGPYADKEGMKNFNELCDAFKVNRGDRMLRTILKKESKCYEIEVTP